MKVKALESFAGAVTMGAGEEREIHDEEIVRDLLNARYVEEIPAAEKKMASSKAKTKGGK
jgi:hypothetical protein